jgi:hypothetical protein
MSSNDSNITSDNSDKSSDSSFRLLNPNTQANAQANASDIKDSDKEKVRQYIQTLIVEKEKISSMSKEDLVNLIMKQNNMISQQSQSMMEIVELSNMIQNVNKGNNLYTETQKQNEMCTHISGLQKQQMTIYEQSQKIQLLLFLLFILVIGWLLYHYIH